MTSTVTWKSTATEFDSHQLSTALAGFIPMTVTADRYAAGAESFTARPLDDLVHVDLSWGPRTAIRDLASSTAPSEHYFALTMVHQGSETVVSEDTTCEFRKGDIALWHCDTPTTVKIPTYLRKSGILIPERVMRHMSLPRRTRRSFEHLNDAPTAAMMAQLMDYLADLPSAAGGAHRHVRNSLLHMAIGTIDGCTTMERSGISELLYQQVLDWIDEHLFDDDLSSDAVARAHAVSVRTLHRTFHAQSQRLAEIIRRRKLERARDLLTDPQRPVTWVSERLNFANPSHFSRAFSRQYGMSPSEYRASVLGDWQHRPWRPVLPGPVTPRHVEAGTPSGSAT